MPREPFVEWQERFGQAGTDVLERLHTARADHGSIRSEDLHGIAEDLGWPVAAVAGAASFYADFTAPRLPRHVRVCEGTSCFVSTAGRNVAQVEEALATPRRSSSSDGSVSLDGAYCLGYCYTSPAALDGTRARTGANLPDQLRRCSGNDPPPVPHQSAVERPVLLSGLLGTEPPWAAWPTAITTLSPAEVLAEITTAQLRGRGGAEFPVAAKWRAASLQPPPRYVVANGDEGDPGSFCDRLLMEHDPHRVLEGLALAGYAIGAPRGFVFVRSEYPAALQQMRAAVERARAAGHLGAGVHGSTVDFDVEVVQGAGSYVAGEETALLHALQGLRGSVRPRPPYPTSRGFGEHPTAINNVETLAAVPWIVHHGGAAYAQLGTSEETGTKLVCLSERFRNPGVYEVEFGVSLRWLVEDLGGGLHGGRTLRAVQVGGPLGGFLAPGALDVPLLAGALADAGVALGHGSLVAIDDAVRPDELLEHVWSFAAAESCGACTPCRVGTRRGQELVEHAISEPLLHSQERLLEVMGVGSMCAFGRSVPGAVRSLVRVYRDELLRGAR